jgi:2-enoate reductase
VIAVNGMDDPAAATEAIRKGRCDLVAVGRQLIADAAWPRKVQENRLSEIVGCTQCNKGCYGSLRKKKPVACVQWSGDETANYIR